MSTEITAPKQRGRPFIPGQSGNPNGRPKGARNRATIAAEALLEGEAEALTRKAIELAMSGDVTALRLCLERLLPPRRERAVSVSLPPMTGTNDASDAIDAVLEAVTNGDITPREAAELVRLIEARREVAEGKSPPTSVAMQIVFVDPPAPDAPPPNNRFPRFAEADAGGTAQDEGREAISEMAR